MGNVVAGGVGCSKFLAHHGFDSTAGEQFCTRCSAGTRLDFAAFVTELVDDDEWDKEVQKKIMLVMGNLNADSPASASTTPSRRPACTILRRSDPLVPGLSFR